MKFVDEFKDFISRGNVVDMAVGVVVGGAFKSIVDSLVADIIDPGIAYVVSLITGALKTAATSTVGDTSAVESVMDMSKWIIPGTSINIGNFLSAIINFLILAFIIFCVVKGLNKLNDKFKKTVEEEVTPAGPTQEELLAEIRDLLKDKEYYKTQSNEIRLGFLLFFYLLYLCIRLHISIPHIHIYTVIFHIIQIDLRRHIMYVRCHNLFKFITFSERNIHQFVIFFKIKRYDKFVIFYFTLNFIVR